VQSGVLAPHLPDRNRAHLVWQGLAGNAGALALARAAAKCRAPILVIAADERQAYALEEALRFFADDGTPVWHFPDWETLPFDVFSPHQDIVSDRLATLYRLPACTEGLVIVSADTLLQRLPPRSFLDARALLVRVGEHLDPHVMRERLEHVGYQAVTEVQAHGEYAVRGALLDIFPMGSGDAYRIDLFDDEVESIRRFDPETQRSIEKIEEIRLLPAREFPLDREAVETFRGRYRARFPGDPRNSLIYRDVSRGFAPGGIEYYLPLFFEHTASLLDYLPAGALVACAHDIEQALAASWRQIEERFRQRQGDIERPLLRPEEAFHTVSKISDALQRRAGIWLEGGAPDDACAVHFAGVGRSPLPTGNTDAGARLQALIRDYDGRILLLAESAGRRELLLDALKPLGVAPRPYTSWARFLGDDKRLGIAIAPLEHGLTLTDPDLTVIAEPELFGSRPPQRRRRRAPVRDPEAILRDLTDLSEGSPVVHQDHGVGRYLGLQHLKLGAVEQEFLTIEYAGGDKLYVPVASLHLVHRYTGAEPEHAPLHRLGSEHWQKVRRRAAKRARDVAAELLDIHARRAARQGFAFSVPAAEYQRFSEDFPFTETPDQESVIESVLSDMRAARPMDRVVCGDVGFGKTEVAMRAAFVAVMNARQVCILVPTTLLAQQHYQNFIDRFADWAVRIGALSRLRSRKEQANLLEQLAEGKVDIAIGTHRLLQKDVKFKNLGLVIVDEEHRFGVRHKERLKALRAEVDMLTLTATPIPRTLNMSLSGLRDLSIIATPPAQRLAVKTFVAEWDRDLMRDACLREIKRGGQVYILHNQVEDIERFAERVRNLVPEAGVRVAHGQMRERELEQVMLDFYHRRFNVLVCTTIIESGIDVPTANTIIIDRADRFGLAQLHQLRGRVGRSHHRAYAYLLVPDKRALTGDAAKRLEAIESLGDLGAGFTLATHDLEIRGAGELLGEEQSGQIEEVGFSLYSQLLERSVQAIKAGKLPDEDVELSRDTEVDLGVTALLPEDYIPDVQMRLILYKRVSNAGDDAALRELQVELIDRFGLLPEPARNLFRVTALKFAASPLGISKLEAGVGSGRVIFSAQPHIDPARLVQLIQQEPSRYSLDGQDKLLFEADMETTEARFDQVEALLQRLGARERRSEPAEA